LGPRVPARLKVFLTPPDIAQVLGAVPSIALVYTDRM
jgi:Na+/H+ antiporter NhaA